MYGKKKMMGGGMLGADMSATGNRKGKKAIRKGPMAGMQIGGNQKSKFEAARKAARKGMKHGGKHNDRIMYAGGGEVLKPN